MAGLLDIMRAWGSDTAHQSRKWTLREPSTGQCAVTALCVQDILGGTIRVCKVGRQRHYYNDVPGQGTLDLTAGQFGWEYTQRRELGLVTREQLLRHPDTRRRYELLKARAGIGG